MLNKEKILKDLLHHEYMHDSGQLKEDRDIIDDEDIDEDFIGFDKAFAYGYDEAEEEEEESHKIHTTDDDLDFDLIINRINHAV